MSDRCHWTQDRLSAYADGELPPPEEERVRDHVAGCADCRDALAVIVLADEAIAAEDVTRGAEDWEALASRVDAAVARAHEQDLLAERTAHGWRRKKPGFLGGLLPAPIAFGSAGTIVAAVLVVLMHGLLEDRSSEQELLPPDELTRTRAPAPIGALESAPAARERMESLGYVGTGGAGRTEPVVEARKSAAPPAASPPPEAGPRSPTQAPEAVPEGKELRPIETALRMSPPASAEPSDVSAEAPEEAIASVDDDAIVVADDDAKVTADDEPAAGEATETEAEPAPPVPAEDPRTLEDLAKDYASRPVLTSPPPSPAVRDRPASRRTTRPDAMSRTLEEQRRETDQALSLALAREVYLFAQERREEGDEEGAIAALSLLLDNEHARIREQAWADLISLEGERAIEEGEVVEIARVASASDAFLREYPSSRFRVGVIKRRVRLWAAAVEQRPDFYCEPARAAEVEWQSVIGAQTDPAGAEASDRIRAACDR